MSVNGTTAAITNRTPGPTQSVSLNAPVGSDLFVFNIYDAPDGRGNLLGTASVIQQIVDGSANTVTASIQAVCVTINVASTGDDPLLSVHTGVTGLLAPTVQSIVLAGQSSATFIAAPEDADANIIISGNGGTITHAITGSATFTPIDGAHFSLTPLSGPRTTTPDTLTLALPTCPQTTVAVQHSPAIYAQGANGVSVYDWYGDLLLSANIGSNTLIGYDTSLKAIMTLDSVNGEVSSYSSSLGQRTGLFSTTSTNAVWSNYLHTIVGTNPVTRQLSQLFVGTGTTIGAPIANPSALGTSPLSTSPYAYAAPGGTAINVYSLAALAQIGGAATSVGVQITSFAVDDTDNYVYAFFGTQLIQRYTEQIGSSYVELSGPFGFSDPVTYGAMDTDGDNLVGLSSSGSLYISSSTAQLAGFATNVGTASALVVVSTNTH